MKSGVKKQRDWMSDCLSGAVLVQEKDNVELTCPACGLLQSQWKKSGIGHYQEGETFCCLDCAQGVLCDCDH